MYTLVVTSFANDTIRQLDVALIIPLLFLFALLLVGPKLTYLWSETIGIRKLELADVVSARLEHRKYFFTALIAFFNYYSFLS